MYMHAGSNVYSWNIIIIDMSILSLLLQESVFFVVFCDIL